MIFNILTLFPDTLLNFFHEGITGRALERGVIKVNVVCVRDFSRDKHKKVDDYPYGGGRGMLMTPDPLFRAFESIGADRGKTIYLGPLGAQLTQRKVRELTGDPVLTLICGHYEGIDHRVIENLVDEEISIGDYILTCGELAAAVMIDAIARELEGTLGHEESKLEESFDETGLLEYEQYTRPVEYRGHSVPEVLLSGNHEDIRKWRMKRRIINTLERRPDLLEEVSLLPEYKELLIEVLKERDNEYIG
jgi:tRNA (guanine37-N1)-methyltransferase